MTEASTQTRHGGCKVRARERTSKSQAAVGRRYISRNLPTYDFLGEDCLVRIEAGLLSEGLRSAPAEFTRCAPNSARNIQIGGRKSEELQNFLKFIKVIHSCPWSHQSGEAICESADAPACKRHLDRVCSHIRYSKRPFMRSVTAEKRSEHSIDIAHILLGGVFADHTFVILGIVKSARPPSGAAP